MRLTLNGRYLDFGLISARKTGHAVDANVADLDFPGRLLGFLGCVSHKRGGPQRIFRLFERRSPRPTQPARP